MSKNQLLKILTHPFFIGFIITAIIALIVMPDVSKYKADVKEIRYNKDHTLIFSDLDADHNSEEIDFDIKTSLFKIMVRQGKGIKEQYNLGSKPIGGGSYFTGDYNNDGLKEIYLLTINSDSLLLSIIDPFHSQDFIVKERLIFYNDTLSFVGELPIGYFVGLTDSESGKNIVFSLSAGFSKQPRSFFSYNINKDELKVSPLSGVSIQYPFKVDLNGDSIPEILFNTGAVGNYNSYVPFTDQSCWLMVLNRNLEFYFRPIEFPKYPSNLFVSSIKSKDSIYIVGLHEYFGTDTISSGIYLFDYKGNKIRSKPIKQIERSNYYLARVKLTGDPRIYIIDNDNRDVRIFDEELNEIQKQKIPKLDHIINTWKLDIDQDGSDEHLFRGEKPGTLVIFREDFRHPLVIDLNDEYFVVDLSICLRDGVPYLYAQFIDRGYLLQYKLNPIYYLQYPLLIISYLAISLAIFLIFRIQKYRAERYYQTKRKLGELQILNLKNQIDPHFTFNILNSIGSLYTRGANKDLAYNIFVKYSNMLRYTISHTDQISITLSEELDFVNNYVELEQFRSGNAFKYEFKVEDGVQLDKTIPRMLIHSFVENSIKHGVRMAEKDPLLELIVSRDRNAYKILIRDNGPGLNSKPKKQPPGTGKGLQIIDEMIDLFYQLEKVRINYTLEDLSLKYIDRKGTEVIITIPVKSV